MTIPRLKKDRRSPRLKMRVRALPLGLGGATLLSIAACQTKPPPEPLPAGEPIEARVTMDLRRPGRPVNRLVLGNNVQWVDRGDGLLQKDSNRLEPALLQLVRELGPTVLRYPGGTNADYYHWRDGVGLVSSRQENRTVAGRRERILFGTDEFLDLCRLLGAEPLITVNVATGTPEEAAEWVAHTNRKRQGPAVRFWEIGNEPYLEASIPEARMEPAEYARRAGAFIRAMKRADPLIQVGLPLRNDQLGGVSATPFRGFNRVVLSSAGPLDFVALHGSYFPVTFDKTESQEDLYLATVASFRTLEEDLAATRAIVREYRPERMPHLAVTEYNALYSLDILRLGLASLVFSKTDRLIETMAGALYVADALRVFAQTDDLLMANYWSLSGNWYFGAVDHRGRPRPSYHVLRAFGDLLQGRLVALEVDGPTFSSPRVGFAAAQSAVPFVDGLGTHSDHVLRLVVLNRHPRRQAALRILVRGLDAAHEVAQRQLSSSGYFDRDVRWVEDRHEVRNGRLDVRVSPHSVTFFEIPL
jgi:alpha-N-arabinofuranosidase